MKLSVIIVNYNVKMLLEQCLHSVMRAAEGLDAEVLVVDNNSTDGSVEYLRERFPEVRFIENKENTGFARANNIAIKESKGEYVLLLNPDTFVGESLLNDVLEFMDEHQDAGGAGVMMLNADGSFAKESRRGVPSPLTAFCKMSGLATLMPKNRVAGHYYMSYLPKDEASEIEIMSGACMFLRRKALDEVGLLDETFFMYGEDIDLSYRLLKGGWKNWYVPSAMVHYKGESTKHHSISYVNAFYKAMVIFFRKHFSEYGVLVEIPVYGAIYAKAVADYVMRNVKNLFDTKQSSYYLNRKRVAVIAAEKNMKSMAEEAGKSGMKVTEFVVDDALRRDGHCDERVAREHFDTVVYDRSEFSFDRVLEIMKRGASRGNKTKTMTGRSGASPAIMS